MICYIIAFVKEALRCCMQSAHHQHCKHKKYTSP